MSNMAQHEDRGTRMARIVWPCEHGLLFLCSPAGPRDHAALPTSGRSAHALEESLAIAVRHYVDGDVTVDVWDGPAKPLPDSETVFAGILNLGGEDLMLTDTEDRLRIRFPSSASCRLVVRAQGVTHVRHLLVELHD